MFHALCWTIGRWFRSFFLGKQSLIFHSKNDMAELESVFENIHPRDRSDRFNELKYFFTQTVVATNAIKEDYRDAIVNRDRRSTGTFLLNGLVICIPSKVSAPDWTYEIVVHGDQSLYCTTKVSHSNGTVPHVLIPLKTDTKVCCLMTTYHKNQIIARYRSFVDVPEKFRNSRAQNMLTDATGAEGTGEDGHDEHVST